MEKLIGQYLLEDGLVSDEQLRKALALQARQAGKAPLLGKLLMEMGALDEEVLTTELERQALERVRLYGRESPDE